MPDQPFAESPPLASPDAGTPAGDFDETLLRAIDAGKLGPSQAADGKLAGAFAAHQKLETLFALLRGPAQPDMHCRERTLWRSADQPEPAPTHLGRYQVRSTLGSGTFGTVYLADDPELGRAVAIKVPRAGSFASADDADKFLAEARLVARLNHPAIVGVYDVGREGDRSYIVMQYMAGKTLEDLLAFRRPGPTETAEVLAAVADALHHAHKQGFIHRDLKPSNILLDTSVGNGAPSGPRGVPPVGNALRGVPPGTDGANSAPRNATEGVPYRNHAGRAADRVPHLGRPLIAVCDRCDTRVASMPLAGKCRATLI
ncbi:MAG TPA: serine/threonine-protein kinase [Pirellulales bacterium]|nr:serine/threonine-protein kinase [Pirellulales bacterium]